VNRTESLLLDGVKAGGQIPPQTATEAQKQSADSGLAFKDGRLPPQRSTASLAKIRPKLRP